MLIQYEIKLDGWRKMYLYMKNIRELKQRVNFE